MPYPISFVRMTVGGNTASEDIWSNGLSFAAFNNASSLQLFQQLDPTELLPAISAMYIGASSTGMNSFNTLETVKLALIGTDGKYLADPKIYDYPTPPAGTGNFGVSPQDTVVLSLLTGQKRGLARRGRIYLPAGFAAPVPLTGRLAPASVTGIADRGRVYINAINTVLAAKGTPGTVAIMSNQRTGQVRYVTAVEVGNLMDNQNRRRNRLEEAYTERSLVTPVTTP